MCYNGWCRSSSMHQFSLPIIKFETDAPHDMPRASRARLPRRTLSALKSGFVKFLSARSATLRRSSIASGTPWTNLVDEGLLHAHVQGASMEAYIGNWSEAAFELGQG